MGYSLAAGGTRTGTPRGTPHGQTLQHPAIVKIGRVFVARFGRKIRKKVTNFPHHLLCIVPMLTGTHLEIPLNRGPSRTLEQEFSVTRPLNVQRRGPKLGQDRIVHTHSCTRCRSWLRSQATGALACRSHSGYSTGQNTESSDSGCKNLQMNSARPRV